MRQTILEALVIFGLVFCGFLALSGPDETRIPQCQEDAIIIGDGDFEDGRWERYICGPSFDDLETSFEEGPDED